MRRRAAVASSPRAVVATTGSAHPLEPLSSDEIMSAFALIEGDARFPSGAVFPIVQLKEPPKREVLAWSAGKPFRREAFANVYHPPTNKLYEVIVDLAGKRIASWEARPGLQPAIYNPDEYNAEDALVRADPRWVAAMKARGLNPDDVYLDGWAPGDIQIPAGVKPGTRLMRALSFYHGPLPNPYDRPVEGVLVTLDMNAMKVVEVLDTGVRPVDTTTSGSASTTRTGLKKLTVSQPDGPSFQLDGHAVTWQNWHFRIGYGWREGLILHQIGYEDKGVVRPIIYRLSQTEIFVPYGLPDRTWVWRDAFDVGEYNLGQYGEPLAAGVDVPENAVFFDQVGPTPTGSAGGTIAMPSAVAMYERDAGSMWDRTDPTFITKDARFARELVVTAVYYNGNYTYGNEFVFRMDGGIDVHINATGTTLNRGVRSNSEGSKYGTMVNKNIAAPIHQHYFNFRIDFDVDGTSNTVGEENVQSVSSSFGNAFDVVVTELTDEGHRDADPAAARRWVVQSATKTNALGAPTGYEIESTDTAIPFASSSFVPVQKAAFAQHPLWVTRYRDGELYASGSYPNQGPINDGLGKYASGAQNIADADLVVWFTAGFTHITDPENYPVLPTDTLSFSLRPSGFFDQNPALDLP
jgi:primary-amine oxidase